MRAVPAMAAASFAAFSANAESPDECLRLREQAIECADAIIAQALRRGRLAACCGGETGAGDRHQGCEQQRRDKQQPQRPDHRRARSSSRNASDATLVDIAGDEGFADTAQENEGEAAADGFLVLAHDLEQSGRRWERIGNASRC